MSSATIRNGITLRLLVESDAQAAFAIHSAATTRLSSDIVRQDSLHFIREQINDGFVVGGFTENKALVAYATLTVSNIAIHKIADLLQLELESRKRFCLLDGVAVHPDWQLRGLHHALIAERLCYARDLGKDIVGVTVSPRNLKSLKSLIDTGFLVVQATLLYGGYERLVLTRNLGNSLGTGYTCVKTVNIERFDECVEAIQSGFCGFKLSWDEQGKVFMNFGSRIYIKNPA
jgi:GNAT superfamily N-acetyltransferase